MASKHRTKFAFLMHQIESVENLWLKLKFFYDNSQIRNEEILFIMMSDISRQNIKKIYSLE